MNKLRNSRTFRICISVFAALVIWLYVENIDPSIVSLSVRNIQVEFIGEEDLEARGLMVASDMNMTVNLTLQGQRNVISRLGDGSDIRVRVNLSSITSVGQYSLTYQVVYPDSVSENSLDVVEASAPLPSGMTSIRRYASRRRPISRSSIWT